MASFRGFPACSCLIEWLPAFEAELLRRGVLKPGQRLRIYQLIGGAPQSGGTHSTGGAADLLDLPGNVDLWTARQMGADAAWSRPYNWDGRKGIPHIHLVLTGCPHASKAARDQIVDVRANRNGLANNGKDTGPRPLSGRTYKQGIAWAKSLQEDDMPLSDEDIKKIAAAVWNADIIPIEEPVGTEASRKANPTWAARSVMANLLKLAWPKADDTPKA